MFKETINQTWHRQYFTVRFRNSSTENTWLLLENNSIHSHTMKGLLHRPRIKLNMLWSVQVFENFEKHAGSHPVQDSWHWNWHTSACVHVPSRAHIIQELRISLVGSFSHHKRLLFKMLKDPRWTQIVRWLVLIPRSVPLMDLPAQCRSQVDSNGRGSCLAFILEKPNQDFLTLGI